jgi:hypothetical protein
MKPQPTCEDLLDLIPAYSIGATDDDETRQIEEGLSRCPDLADELAQYLSLDDLMADAAPTLIAPPAILANLLASAKATLPRQRRNFPLWQLVAACLALVLVVSNVYWAQRLNNEAVREIALAVPANNPSATGSGRVVWSSQAETALLVAENLPLLTPDSSYQAWLRRGETRINLGVFRVDEKGNGTLSFPVSHLVGAFDALGITTEPLNGSDAPTTPAVIRWSSA